MLLHESLVISCSGLFESYYRAAPDGGVDSGGTHVHAGFLDRIGDAALGTEDTVVGYLDMSRYAYLAREDTMLADFRTTGDTYLGAEESGFTYLYVMRYLHEVVYLRVLADDGRTHHGAVDGGVGTYLHVVLDDDSPDLRDLLIDALCIGFEAETVCTDDYTGMEDTSFADKTVGVDLHARIKDGTLADGDIIADIDVRVYLYSLAQTHVLTDISKSAYVGVCRNGNPFGDEGGLLDTFLGREHRLADHRQKLSHRAAGILHEDESAAGFAFAVREGDLALYQGTGDEYHAGLGGLQAGDIFLVRHEGEVLRLRLLDRGYVADHGIGVAV